MGKDGSAPQMATVDRVVVYPSNYGKEQLAEEAQAGPPALTGAVGAASIADDDESVAMQSELLRKSQLQRTRYYYAVADCDSVSTACWLYDQLDGLEVDGICPGALDLRFVPDGLQIPHVPRGEAIETPNKYQAPVLHHTGIG